MFVVQLHSKLNNILMHNGTDYCWDDYTTIDKYKSNNTKEHPFLFEERGDAWHTVTNIRFPDWLRVVDYSKLLGGNLCQKNMK